MTEIPEMELSHLHILKNIVFQEQDKIYIYIYIYIYILNIIFRDATGDAYMRSLSSMTFNTMNIFTFYMFWVCEFFNNVSGRILWERSYPIIPYFW